MPCSTKSLIWDENGYRFEKDAVGGESSDGSEIAWVLPRTDVQGWRDAASVTDVAIAYVREQPQNAVEVLEKIRRLYESSTMPDALVPRIDEFYKKYCHLFRKRRRLYHPF